ncbi:MAG: DUF2510 domain-containing protein [Actinobacteria bacterium]|nr:DUF2510 domain-containing protein [Actinomycetota bacterium]
MARGRAISRRNLAEKQSNALRPYQDVKTQLAGAIANLSRAKAQVSAQASAGTASAQPAATTPVPPPPTPATWAPDPYGRHELRYWDGMQWTEHVSNRGVSGTDFVPRPS